MPADLTPEALGVTSDTAPDNVFELIVHVANTSDLEMNVTLHVNGQVITGKLISGATFWSESAQDIRARTEGPSDLTDAMASSMERVADEYRSTYAEDTSVEEGNPPMTAFVHLRDARTITPQGPLPTPGGLWRGRLSSVDGFTFGEINTGSGQDEGGGARGGSASQAERQRAAAQRNATARRGARRAVEGQRRAVPDRSAARPTRSWVGETARRQR